MTNEIQNPKYKILKAIDRNKDQSYFLAFVKREVLACTLFPLGGYTKSEVREMARKLNLPNAERKDSQGICFVGKIEIDEFLKRYIPLKKGSIVNTKGEVMGEHEGAAFYTVGQRRGIKLPGGPYYVVEKDVAQNKLVVSKEEKDVLQKEVRVENINWFCQVPKTPLEVGVKLRYRQEDAPAILEPKGESLCVLKLFALQRAVTPGQFAVFYKEGEVLGAGIISSLKESNPAQVHDILASPSNLQYELK